MTGLVTRNNLIIAAAITALMAVILAHIAVTADAYVTFRVVDNFVHGYGLRWNIGERVQVYTHPLWMLLHIPLYALGINIFYVTVAISCACTLGALLITIHTLRKPWPQTIGLFALPLLASQSFTYSSMNGLENPLEHLLFACFGWALLRSNKYFWFLISFFCALSLITRLDTILLYAPIIAYLVVTRRRSLKFGQCLLGALPFAAWELFSLFYYGFLFPNTAYAKLEGIASADAIHQGFHYLLNLLALDITSAEFLFLGVVVLPLWCRFGPKGKTIRPEMVFLALGILLYVLYVIDIGGTFLSGRFWSLPVFASVWLAYAVASDHIGKKICLGLAALLLLVKLAYPGPGVLSRACPPCFTGGIWPNYYSVSPSGYKNGNTPRPLPVAKHDGQPLVSVFTGVSIFGFEAGPALTAINPYAFTDPLLARLPNAGVPLTRSVNDHWRRDIPAGYVYAVKTGSLEKMDPMLAEYYGKLRLIISGNLWDKQRLKEIFKFNRGDYDYLLGEYINNIVKKQ